MSGMNKKTGRPLKGHAHLRQSITDILTTPIGSRVMRRDYGSRLFNLIDAPLNKDTISEVYAATAEALDRWEPRLRLLSLNVAAIKAGKIALDLVGEYLPDGEQIRLERVIV